MLLSGDDDMSIIIPYLTKRLKRIPSSRLTIGLDRLGEGNLAGGFVVIPLEFYQNSIAMDHKRGLRYSTLFGSRRRATSRSSS